MIQFTFKKMGRFYKGSSTHFPLLIKLALKTDGGILECGTGLFSTPLLHWLASERQRLLISYDDHSDFYELNRKFQNRYHRIRLTKDWKDVQSIGGHWSVALIDQSTKNRAPTAIALKDKVDFVILHDSNSPHHYRYETVWPHFKYRYDYTKQDPNTSVVSNFNDLEWLKDETL